MDETEEEETYFELPRVWPHCDKGENQEVYRLKNQKIQGLLDEYSTLRRRISGKSRIDIKEWREFHSVLMNILFSGEVVNTEICAGHSFRWECYSQLKSRRDEEECIWSCNHFLYEVQFSAFLGALIHNELGIGLWRSNKHAEALEKFSLAANIIRFQCVHIHDMLSDISSCYLPRELTKSFLLYYFWMFVFHAQCVGLKIYLNDKIMPVYEIFSTQWSTETPAIFSMFTTLSKIRKEISACYKSVCMAEKGECKLFQRVNREIDNMNEFFKSMYYLLLCSHPGFNGMMQSSSVKKSIECYKKVKCNELIQKESEWLDSKQDEKEESTRCELANRISIVSSKQSAEIKRSVTENTFYFYLSDLNRMLRSSPNLLELTLILPQRKRDGEVQSVSLLSDYIRESALEYENTSDLSDDIW